MGGPTWKGENEKEFRKEQKALIKKKIVVVLSVLLLWVTMDSMVKAYGLSCICLPNVIAVRGLNHFGYPAQFNACGERPFHSRNSIYHEGKGSSCAAPAVAEIVTLLKQCARKSDVEIDVFDLLKIFRCAKKEVKVNDMEAQLFIPEVFF